MMEYEKDLVSVKTEEAEIVWRSSMMRIVSGFIYKSQQHENIRKICQASLLDLELKVEQELAKLDMGNHVEKEGNHLEADETPILDPPQAKSKGSNGRVEGHFEKRKPKSGKTSSSKYFIFSTFLFF
ncbi:unnamed protein product [Linum trigynum]|uniref:Uncharacterized protein n=1 Tax=Linum trigynum TaxID=586398 RepID=A0AAV2F7Q7_9ROSI